jgi:alpha-ketoglutarate-dependent taurine dioxygenase
MASHASEITVKDVSPMLGAEIVGLDIKSDRLDGFWRELVALLSDRHVLLFRDQELGEADMEKFASRFGAFERSVTERPDGVINPPVHYITNFDKDGKPAKTPFQNSNYFWHSDKAFRPTGSAMVFLYGVELPPKGGDTQFANMNLAYEALSSEDKALVDGLQVVHSFEHMRLTRMMRPLSDLERSVVPPPHVHPMVRTDPKTGRKSLFLGMYASEVVGMGLEEGRALLKRLEDHATSPQFVYTHTWRKGDFFFWDNLCLLHRALPNYEMEAYRRVMMRCGIKSELVIQ